MVYHRAAFNQIGIDLTYEKMEHEVKLCIQLFNHLKY